MLIELYVRYFTTAGKKSVVGELEATCSVPVSSQSLKTPASSCTCRYCLKVWLRACPLKVNAHLISTVFFVASVAWTVVFAKSRLTHLLCKTFASPGVPDWN